MSHKVPSVFNRKIITILMGGQYLKIGINTYEKYTHTNYI